MSSIYFNRRAFLIENLSQIGIQKSYMDQEFVRITYGLWSATLFIINPT